MDVEQNIEFILEQKALLIQQVEENATQIGANAEHIGRIAKQVDVIAQATQTLVQGQQESRDAIDKVNDNLSALVKVVEELVRRGNGR